MSAESRVGEEAIVCSDVTSARVPIPKALKQLLQVADVKTEHDVLCIALHVMSLEYPYGFVPLSVDKQCIATEIMPSDWKKPNCYTLKYYHPSCPDQVCVWAAVPMGCLLLIHGHVEDAGKSTSSSKCSLRIDVHTYVRKQEWDDAAVEMMEQYRYCDLPALSRLFKDSILYVLLTSAQQISNLTPTFGLNGLCAELKLDILKRLDVFGVVAMSRVNTDFYELANTQLVWKELCMRDFGKDESLQQTTDSQPHNEDWKRHYKLLFLLKKEGKRHIIRTFGSCVVDFPRLDPRFPPSRDDVYFWPGRRPRHPLWPPFPAYF